MAKVGDSVTVEWTWGGSRFEAAGIVEKVNVKSVKVKLTEDAGEHFKPGYVITTVPWKVKAAGMREAPRAGNPTTKPGKHGTLYLYRITYKDANDAGAPEFTMDKWAYSLEHIDDITEGWAEDGWKILSVARVPANGGSMHRAIRHRTQEDRRVADFNTVDDLADHARREGATHIMHIDDEIHIYFKRRDGKYEKAEVWQKDGYWHTQAPGSRAVVPAPPRGAQIIGRGRPKMVETSRADASGAYDWLDVSWTLRPFEHGGKDVYAATIDDGRYGGHGLIRIAVDGSWRDASTLMPVAETEPWITYINRGREARGRPPLPVGISERRPRVVDDYIAVDRRGRTTAGPFKSYGDARGAAGPADVVQFVPAGRKMSESSRRWQDVPYEELLSIAHAHAWSADRDAAQREIERRRAAGRRVSEAKLPGDSGPPYTIEELNTVLGTRRHPPTPYGSFDEAVQAALAKAGRVRSFVTIVILDRKERPVTDFVGTAG